MPRTRSCDVEFDIHFGISLACLGGLVSSSGCLDAASVKNVRAHTFAGSDMTRATVGELVVGMGSVSIEPVSVNGRKMWEVVGVLEKGLSAGSTVVPRESWSDDLAALLD